jgi:hypothetical protein
MHGLISGLTRKVSPTFWKFNANPCITPGAGFYAACEQAGYSFRDVLDRIIASSWLMKKFLCFYFLFQHLTFFSSSLIVLLLFFFSSA